MLSIGQKITVPNEWLSVIDNFVDESWKYHVDQGRNSEQIKDDIRLGKMGEVGYYLMMKENGCDITEPNFVILKHGDPGHDFVCTKKTVDVKTSSHNDKHYRVIMGKIQSISKIQD